MIKSHEWTDDDDAERFHIFLCYCLVAEASCVMLSSVQESINYSFYSEVNTTNYKRKLRALDSAADVPQAQFKILQHAPTLISHSDNSKQQ